MSFQHFSILTFLGALAVFIYGIRLARTGVQSLAGDRLRVLIARVTDNRFMAISIGAMVTLILQSSNATTISLVSFTASGVMTLTQAMGVMLGADIGSTFVVILLAVEELAQYSLLLIIAGVLVGLLSKNKRSSYVGNFLMGFGFIFFGMKLMVLVTEPLESAALFQSAFAYLSARPLLSFFAAVVFTVLVQNSAAPIGLAIALSFSGILDLGSAVPIVLGANVGTCSGSIIASLGSNSSGKQLALAHLSAKVLGAALVFVLFEPFVDSIRWITGLIYPGFPVGGLIAAAHLIFNVYLVILLAPLIGPAAWLLRKIIPEPPPGTEEKFRPLYLDRDSLDVPSLAFANVRREIMRMLDMDQGMFRDCLKVLKNNDHILLEKIQSQDDQVDVLDKAIKFYLAKLSQENLTEKQAAMELRLVEMTSTLEEIGDVIDHNILELAEKKIRKALSFSAEGWKEIVEFHSQVMEGYKLTAAALATEDEGLAKKMLRHHEHLASLEREGRQGHLQRLHQGLKESIETSSLHLDLLSNFYRVDHLLAALVKQAYPKL